MTAIRGMIGSNKRPGELGIHSMNTFHLMVPDLKVAQDFYSAFGLEVKEEGNSLGLYTFGTPNRWGLVSEGPRKKLSHLTFGVFEEDFDPMKRRIEAAGVRLLDVPPGSESDGIWFKDPDGVLIEVRIAEKVSPDEKSFFLMKSQPPGTMGAVQRSKVHAVRPRRLAHILIFTSSVQGAIDFYGRVLGLRLSDRAGDNICFMHGIHGSDHHLVAFARSSGPGFHHCSWDVGSINDIGIGAMQMADKGYVRGWGMGRHVLGSNYFHYVRDPWGSFSEYSADIDYVPLDHDWNAGDYPPEDSLYLWGPDVPDDFVMNHER